MSGDLSVRLGHLNPASDRAVFRQIADHLRAGVERGQLSEGEQLPSEAQLIEHYGVARMTVRHAIQVLQGEGLVVAEHGRGVFVVPARQSGGSPLIASTAVFASRAKPRSLPRLNRRAALPRWTASSYMWNSLPSMSPPGWALTARSSPDIAATCSTDTQWRRRSHTSPSISPAGHRSPSSIPGQAESMPVSKNSAIGSITLKKRSGPACLLLTRQRRCCFRPGSPYFILSGPLMTPRTERWKSVTPSWRLMPTFCPTGFRRADTRPRDLAAQPWFGRRSRRREWRTPGRPSLSWPTDVRRKVTEEPRHPLRGQTEVHLTQQTSLTMARVRTR